MTRYVGPLELPGYFGRNWDALDECLIDLSWLPTQARVPVITNADQLLTAEPDRERSILVSVLDRAGGEWALPIARNQPWDRPAARSKCSSPRLDLPPICGAASIKRAGRSGHWS
jgi:hypothetical protein